MCITHKEHDHVAKDICFLQNFIHALFSLSKLSNIFQTVSNRVKNGAAQGQVITIIHDQFPAEKVTLVRERAN